MPKRKPWLYLVAGSGVLVVALLLAAALGGAGGSASAKGDEDAVVADDVLSHKANGLLVIAPMREVGPQVLHGDQLLGVWKEDHLKFDLVLKPDSQYRIVYSSSGGSASVRIDERGEWALEEGRLSLTPKTVHRSGAESARFAAGDDLNGGPPRSGKLDGLMLEYTPAGVEPAVAKRLDGLRITGPSPVWFNFGSGSMSLTLRRAPSLNAP